MKDDQFKSLRQRAIELHGSQGGGDKLSLDAVFYGCVMLYRGGRLHRVSDETAPEWFSETMDKLRGTGERFTVSRFLMLAGKYPATRSQQLSVGQWLREEGITPRKIGGQTLFEAPSKPKQGKAKK